MKASVAPIMRATSISAAWAMTCRRMVLKVTATSPAAKIPASIHSASLPSLRKASKRLTQAESSWTWATFGQPAISLRSDFQRFRLGIGRLDDEGIGQRVARQAGDDFGHALAGLHALQRVLFGHEAPFAGGGLRRRFSISPTSFLLASSS
jgi:hypothetical protein